MKNLLLLIFLLIITTVEAQTFGEIELQGNIEVPAGADAQGISIYNKNSGKGSVSTKNGDFSIGVNLNDSLYFSALQFRDLLVVVDEEMVNSQTLYVEITEDINELPEVVIKPHDLTGNLVADLNNIPVRQLDLPTWSAAEINQMNFSFAPDAQSGISNPAMGGGQMEYGFQPLRIIGGLVDLLTPASAPKMEDPYKLKAGYTMLEKELRSRYDNDFFSDVLQIEKEEIVAYIDFLAKQGVAQVLLKAENELQLLDMMILQSAAFRKR